MSTCCHNGIGGWYDILENLYYFIRWNDRGEGVVSPKFNSKLLMDVVTVGHINICINEAGCLKMKNLLYFNGVWYTLNNQDMFLIIPCIFSGLYYSVLCTLFLFIRTVPFLSYSFVWHVMTLFPTVMCTCNFGPLFNIFLTFILGGVGVGKFQILL